MATLRDVSIQPLDVILFRGVDPVSKAICFMEARRLGHGDFSHAGLAITREALDLPFLEPGKVYVWESTLSAKEGFLARFTDKVPDAETKGVRFGVQLRDLELVIPGYSSSGGKVAWCAYLGKRPPLEEVRRQLLALHAEYGHAPYAVGQLKVFGVVFPALRGVRDRIGRRRDRLAHFRNVVLERARKPKRVVDADHHMFCSEWVATVYKQLGLGDMNGIDFDPRLAAPVGPLTRRDLFAEPVYLESEDTASQEVGA
ncbi:MAG TPA: hypothetical protein VMT89_06395 [Candidatus Acidoferrales bacterium]|nr:hypothetical protein [Candidatus Acidoferrales bacterium]